MTILPVGPLHGVLLVRPSTVPVEIGREEARAAAARELGRAIYHTDDPSPLQRLGDWISEQLDRLFDTAAHGAPGGYLGLLVIALVVVAAIVAIRLRIGPVGRVAGGPNALFGDTAASADEHRSAADAFAARGEWAEAVRARLRAVVRGLEERDLLDVRPGRTAHEAAREAGLVLPGCADRLRLGADLFDDVWYGGRPATAEMDATLRSVDEAVRTARPADPVPSA